MDNEQYAPTMTLAPNTEKAMLQMIGIIDSMIKIMDAETEVVGEYDQKAFAVLQNRKIAAASLYQSGVEQMLQRQDEMKNAPLKLKSKLELMRTRFLQSANKNKKALEKMNKGVQRLHSRIMGIAKQEAEKTQKFVYGSQGKMKDVVKSSIGINESA